MGYLDSSILNPNDSNDQSKPDFFISLSKTAGLYYENFDELVENKGESPPGEAIKPLAGID